MIRSLLYSSIIYFCFNANIMAMNFPYDVSKEENKMLFGHYYILEDKNKIYSEIDVSQLSNDNFMKVNSSRDSIQNRERNTLWAKILIQNKSKQKLTRVISSIGLTKDLHLYIFDKKNKLIQSIRTGYIVNYNALPLKYGQFGIPFKIDPDQELTLIFKKTGIRVTELQLKLQSLEYFQKSNMINIILWNIFYGVMFGLFLYNFFIHIFSSNKPALYYTGFICSNSFHMFCLFTPLGIYQVKYFGYLGNLFILTSTLLTIFGHLFISRFFKFKKYYPRSNKILIIIQIIMSIFVAIYYLIPKAQIISQSLQSIGYLLVIFITLFILIKEYLRSKKQSQLYCFIAWISFAIIVFSGEIYTIIGFTNAIIITRLFMAGSIITIIFMSLALTEQTSELRRSLISQYMHIQLKLRENLRIENKEITEAKKIVKVVELLAALGRVASTLAHEINNPLSIVQGHIQRYRRIIKKSIIDSGESDTKIENLVTINKMNKWSLQITEIVKSIHFLGSNDDNLTEKKITNFNSIIESAIALKQSQLISQKINIKILNSSNLNVFSDHVKLIQAYANLIQNSIDSLDNILDDKVEKYILISIHEENHYIIFTIRDSGQGIDPKIKDKVFTPFFSTRKDQDHIGLGLNFSKKILENGQGEISIVAAQQNQYLYIKTRIKIAA